LFFAAAATEHVRSGRRAPGVAALFAPGEPEWRRRQSSNDVVHLTPEVAAMLIRMGRELGVRVAPLDAIFPPDQEETRHAQA